MKCLNLIFIILAFCLNGLSYAAICPLVTNLTASLNQGWKIYDSDTNKPITGRRETAFKHMANQFVLAEWSKKNNGSIHCFYRDKNGSNLEAYLGKSNFMPTAANRYWYTVSGYLQCAAGNERCDFTETPGLHTTYLAQD